MLAAHVLSGCDKVPQLFGIGKKKVIKLLKGQDNNANGIEQLGNIDPDIQNHSTTKFTYPQVKDAHLTVVCLQIRFECISSHPGVVSATPEEGVCVVSPLPNPG